VEKGWICLHFVTNALISETITLQTWRNILILFLADNLFLEGLFACFVIPNSMNQDHTYRS